MKAQHTQLHADDALQAFLFLSFLRGGRNYTEAFSHASSLCAKLCRLGKRPLGVHMIVAPTLGVAMKVGSPLAAA